MQTLSGTIRSGCKPTNQIRKWIAKPLQAFQATANLPIQEILQLKARFTIYRRNGAALLKFGMWEDLAKVLENLETRPCGKNALWK